jgi:hypothetical protein
MALLSDSLLSQRYAEEIRAANDATKRAFNALCDAYLPCVSFYQIADCFTTQAMTLFRTRTSFPLAADGEAALATCTLLFLLDDFFSAPAPPAPTVAPAAAAAAASSQTPHTLYIFQSHSNSFVKSLFHAERTSLTGDEEQILLQLLQEPGTQFYQFQKALRTSFPSIRTRLTLARSVPRFLDSIPFQYYGERRDGTTPFWHLEIHLEYPVLTPSLCQTLRTHTLSVDEEVME